MSRLTPHSRLVQRLSIGVAALTLLGAVGLGGYNLASAEIEEGSRPVFVPINPCRLLDTRASVAVGRSTPLGGPEQMTVVARGSNGLCTGASAIPTDAVGLSMNVVAVRPTLRTYLTFWGEGANPGTANLNPEPGQAPTPNAVTTPLSATGNFNLYNNAGTVDVIIDVNGYYESHNHDDRYLTEAETSAAIDAVDERVPFFIGGIVTDTQTTIPTVTFDGPTGAMVAVSSGGQDTGTYTVTISGLTSPIDGIVQITPFGDANPGPGPATPATACSIDQPISTATTYSFGVGCFGEDDNAPGEIVAEDVSFQFLIVD